MLEDCGEDGISGQLQTAYDMFNTKYTLVLLEIMLVMEQSGDRVEWPRPKVIMTR